jgi:hypothetical protein
MPNSSFPHKDREIFRDSIRQLETDLRPVLRDRDFVAFDFERVWAQLDRVAGMVKSYLGE